MSKSQFNKFKELNNNYNKGNNIKTFPLNKRKVYKSKANEDEFKKL